MDEQEPVIDSEPLPIEEVKKNLETETRELLNLLPKKIGTQDIEEYFDNIINELDKYNLTHNVIVKNHLALTKTFIDLKPKIESQVKMIFQIVRELILTVKSKEGRK